MEPAEAGGPFFPRAGIAIPSCVAADPAGPPPHLTCLAARGRRPARRWRGVLVGERLAVLDTRRGAAVSAARAAGAADAVHAVLLTLDEAMHLDRCLDSLAPVVASVTVVDSGSSDGTPDIARDRGAEVVTNPWVNYATQMNFAIALAERKGGWVMRIDADEVLEPAGSETLPGLLAGLPQEVAGVAVRRRIHFMGRRIRWGGIEPNWQLRLFRAGRGRCEQRWMDEHIVVDGAVARAHATISDINLKPLGWWIDKHNAYASREAIDLLDLRHDFLAAPGGAAALRSSPGASVKRLVKKEVYARLPGGLRATLYFLMRYVALLGFLDGRAGFYFHALQAFWYRTLVDAKMAEIAAHAAAHGLTVPEAIRDRTGFDVAPRPAGPALGAGQAIASRKRASK